MIALFLILYFGLMIISATPLVYAIGIATLALPFVFGVDATMTYTSIAQSFVDGCTANNTGITILLFIVAGDVMSTGKLTEKIFNVFAYFLGKKRGFMPILSILTCMFYGAISGSGPATTAAVGAMCYPMLVEMGYDSVFSAAIIVAAGCLGMVIPPSVPVTGVSALTGGLDMVVLYKIAGVAGVISGILMIVYVFIYCLRKGNGDQTKINAWVDGLHQRGLGNVVKESIWALLTPVLILGSIFTGIADTAQAAALSLVYAIIVCTFVYKTIKPKEVLEVIRKSAINGAPMLIMIAFATTFGNAIAAINLTGTLTTALTSAGITGTMIMIGILILMIPLGCVNAAGVVQIIPVAFPIMIAAGIEPFTASIAVVLMQAVGLITPPVGLCLFVMQPMAKCSLGKLGKAVIPYLLIITAVALFLVLFPQLFASMTAGGFIPEI